MTSQLRAIALLVWYCAKQLLAYLCVGIDWLLTWIATFVTWLADLAEDAAVRLRR